MTRATPPPIHDDVVLMIQACDVALGDRVLAQVRAHAGTAVRFNDGYVFQHLVNGPISVTQLGGLLGVSQQAASKQVADLEARELVIRRADPHDGRSKLVELSRRGWRAVEAGRSSRRALGDEIATVLGPTRAAALLRALSLLSDHLGAADRMAGRQLRPEADR